MSEPWWNHYGRHCRGKVAEFSGETSHSSVQLAAICNLHGGCPVRRACLDAALRERDYNTVRGGANPNRLKEIVRALGDIDAGRPGGKRGRGGRRGLDAQGLYDVLSEDLDRATAKLLREAEKSPSDK